MKKTAMLALAALIAFPGLARDDEFDNVVYRSSNDVVRFELVSNFGYGYHILNSTDFRSNMSDEFFINVAAFGLYPVEAVGIELGLDLCFSDFSSRSHAFLLNQDRLVQAMDFSQLVPGTLDRHRGGFDVFSLNAPLLLKFRTGSFWLGGGAVGSFNLAGTTRYYYRMDNRREEVSERKAKLNSLTYGLVATLGYGDLGLYFKYYPKTSRLLPDGSVDMDYMTLGVIFDF